MKKKEVFLEIQRIAAFFSFDEPYLISRDTDIFKNLGFDNLDYQNFISKLERDFDVIIREWEIEGKSLIGEFVEYIENKLDQ